MSSSSFSFFPFLLNLHAPRPLLRRTPPSPRAVIRWVLDVARPLNYPLPIPSLPCSPKRTLSHLLCFDYLFSFTGDKPLFHWEGWSNQKRISRCPQAIYFPTYNCIHALCFLAHPYMKHLCFYRKLVAPLFHKISSAFARSRILIFPLCLSAHPPYKAIPTHTVISFILSKTKLSLTPLSATAFIYLLLYKAHCF